MKKIITIVGARPQIIKASAISRAISTQYATKIQELIVHTGQHYDENMSEIFFQELGIPKPFANLEVGSSSHAVQTARIMTGVEQLIEENSPDGILIYGDTNSTLAAALAASKIQLPVIHVEAGLRSFNKSMPEEINRIMSDHVSTLLFCPTPSAIENLKKEGMNIPEAMPADLDHPHAYACGDIMYDNSLHFSSLSESKSTILKELKLLPDSFVLVTIHRNSNTDDAERLTQIFEALLEIHNTTGLTIVLPLHPRTRKMMVGMLTEELNQRLDENPDIKIVPPAGFLDIIALEKNARLIVTDSGGLQKEAFFFKKPCVILRPETEWVEIVENGNALLADASFERITKSAETLLAKTDYTYPELFGDGKAAEFIVGKILEVI